MATNIHPGLTRTDYEHHEDRIAGERPSIGVIVALWSPNLSQHAAAIMHELTLITMDSIRALGGRPILVDSSAPAEQHQGTDWHTKVEGFVYLGGADVHPGFYTAVPLDEPRAGIDAAADQFCLNSLHRALADDAPVLTICRGTQLLNVALGGTLVEHIDGHRQQLDGGDTGFVDEVLSLQPESKIANILGRENITVRGSHHQSIDVPGAGVQLTAHAPDGTIEGIEVPGKTWVVGVQWHPEEPRANVTDRQRIFGALIANVLRT